jgi:DtxR family Mn-dependent transcriptional regulator
MARKHRLIERFLVDPLGVPWHLADEEARKMEPGVSDVVAERMHAVLNGATRCPHGNPIPGEDVPRADALAPLDAAEPGASLTIDRIREDLEWVTVDRGGSVVAVGRVLASHLLCVPAS